MIPLTLPFPFPLQTGVGRIDQDRRKRLWSYLFDNLQRATDEIFYWCEWENSVRQCKEVLRVLKLTASDIETLTEQIKIERKASLAAGSEGNARSTRSVSWDVVVRRPVRRTRIEDASPIWSKPPLSRKPPSAPASAPAAIAGDGGAGGSSSAPNRRSFGFPADGPPPPVPRTSEAAEPPSPSTPVPGSPMTQGSAGGGVLPPPLPETRGEDIESSPISFHPPRVKHLQAKLQSPERRKKSATETLRRLEMRHTQAEARRKVLEDRRQEKIKRAARRGETINAWLDADRTRKLMRSIARQEKAEQLRAEEMKKKVSRATNENLKVDEVQFITTITAEGKRQDMTNELQHRLGESERRKREWLRHIEEKASLVSDRAEAVAMRRMAMEDASRKRREVIKRRKVKMEHSRRQRSGVGSRGGSRAGAAGEGAAAARDGAPARVGRSKSDSKITTHSRRSRRSMGSSGADDAAGSSAALAAVDTGSLTLSSATQDNNFMSTPPRRTRPHAIDRIAPSAGGAGGAGSKGAGGGGFGTPTRKAAASGDATRPVSTTPLSVSSYRTPRSEGGRGARSTTTTPMAGGGGGDGGGGISTATPGISPVLSSATKELMEKKRQAARRVQKRRRKKAKKLKRQLDRSAPLSTTQRQRLLSAISGMSESTLKKRVNALISLVSDLENKTDAGSSLATNATSSAGVQLNASLRGVADVMPNPPAPSSGRKTPRDVQVLQTAVVEYVIPRCLSGDDAFVSALSEALLGLVQRCSREPAVAKYMAKNNKIVPLLDVAALYLSPESRRGNALLAAPINLTKLLLIISQVFRIMGVDAPASSSLLRYVGLCGLLHHLSEFFAQVRSTLPHEVRAAQKQENKSSSKRTTLLVAGRGGHDSALQTLTRSIPKAHLELFMGALQLLEAISATPSKHPSVVQTVMLRQGRDGEKQNPAPPPPAGNIVESLKQTGIAGILPLMAYITIRPPPPSRSSGDGKEGSDSVYPELVISLLASCMRVLNAVARLHIFVLQDFGTEYQMEILHLLRKLVPYCAARCDVPRTRELLEQLLLFMGYFSLLNKTNQDLFRWGKVPTLMQRLATLPFSFYSNARDKMTLFPTLICATFGNPANRKVVSSEVNVKAVARFIEKQSASGDAQDEDAGGPWSLQARFPKELWAEAIEFYK